MGRNYLKELSFVILIIWLTMALLAIPVSAEDCVVIGGKVYCLERGDLLYYSGFPGHIGMYSGNGNFIDAHPKNVVDGEEGKVMMDRIEKSRFDKSSTKCYRVETSQTERNAAVTWVEEEKLGRNFNLSPPSPCDPGDEWYCSELVYCAYKEQKIILGRGLDPFGYIEPGWLIADLEELKKSSGSVKATDSDGSTKNCFTTTEMVYAKGTEFCKNTNYNIYVCSHPVRNGDSLSDYIYSSSVNTDSYGYFTPQPKSLRAFVEGDYDIVVDENGDGIYNPDIDAIDRSIKVQAPKPSLTFTIQTAGQPGTLTLTYYEDGVKKTEDWSADSGYEGLKNKPDYECVSFGGPIPHGEHYVNYHIKEYRSDGTTYWVWPINNGGELACQRNDFTIHVGGETWGCIAVSDGDFHKMLEENWPEPKTVETIDLFVKYPDTAYECGKDKKGFGKGKCCENLRDDRGICTKGYCPENKEKGCCQYCDGCYDGNRDPEECRVCYGGEWHSGWQCEEGECVPEASTFVVVAVGLLFLAGYVRLLKRKIF